MGDDASSLCSADDAGGEGSCGLGMQRDSEALVVEAVGVSQGVSGRRCVPSIFSTRPCCSLVLNLPELLHLYLLCLGSCTPVEGPDCNFGAF